jgi:NADPH:quinone reductase-like Zn-dependent oxidoreductase
MNNTDINTRIGWYSKSISSGTTSSGGSEGLDQISAADATWGGAAAFPRIQGADVAGRIVAAGGAVSAERIGQRVLVDPWLRDPSDPEKRNLATYLGSERDGGFAQYAAVPAENAFLINSMLTDAELATFPCSYSTAEHMLQRARLGRGEKVIVTGASGGVGSALVQLAKRRGAWVLAITSRTKMDAIRDLGADAVVDREQKDLAHQMAEIIPGDEVDVFADVVGGPDFSIWFELLCRGGRYVTSGAIAGPIVELDLRTLYLKDLEMHGATVVPPGVFDNLVGFIENGDIRPLLAGEFSINDIRKAQEAFLAKKHIGNFVLLPQ